MWTYKHENIVDPLQWRHNDNDCVSNHQPYGCLLNRLFRRRSKKTSKLRVTGLCVGNSPGPVNSPHKGPVTRKMFPFDDVIMPVMKEKLALLFLLNIRSNSTQFYSIFAIINTPILNQRKSYGLATSFRYRRSTLWALVKITLAAIWI